MSQKTLVIVSGGMDSITLLYHHRQRLKQDAGALFVQYGQRNLREMDRARYHAHKLDVPFLYIEMGSIQRHIQGGALTHGGVKVPTGQGTPEKVAMTTVPNRNMMILSIATSVALARGYDFVSYGALAGSLYPDCSLEFVEKMNRAVRAGNTERVSIIAPFIQLGKREVVELAQDMELDLGETYSCYVGGRLHCGTCPACVARRKGFVDAGIADPTEYVPGMPALESLLASGASPA